MTDPRPSQPHGLSSRTTGLVLLLFAGGLVLFPLALTTGPSDVGANTLWEMLQGRAEPSAALIVAEIRLPRAVLALMIGAALAVAGVVFQGLLTNPLASPFTLGISSGAAFGASIAILLGAAALVLPVAALVGAAATLALVFALSGGRSGLEPKNLILAGIVIGSIFSAAISLVKSLSGESLSVIVFWIMGSLTGRGWNEVLIFLPWLAVGLAGVFVYARDLDLLCLGADHAHSSGVDVEGTRRLLLFFASFLAAAAVAAGGVIGFVGLVVPHMVRITVGPAHRRLMVLSALVGALLLLGADTLGRALAGGGEIPVGVITALVGGPFFCGLLVHKRKSREALK